jgi:predicted nucleotidyltransferase
MLLELDSQLKERLGLSTSQITQLCQKWKISEFALFGSILSNQFHPNSDIDILIRFAPDARQGLLTLAKIRHDLEAKTGREVDLVVKEAIENSENPIRRHEILHTAQIIYEQG